MLDGTIFLPLLGLGNVSTVNGIAYLLYVERVMLCQLSFKFMLSISGNRGEQL
jgi:hypothetical protein